MWHWIPRMTQTSFTFYSKALSLQHAFPTWKLFTKFTMSIFTCKMFTLSFILIYKRHYRYREQTLNQETKINSYRNIRKKSDLVKKGYWNRIHSSVYMCKSDSTETWHNISETQIAKEKMKFVCASHKPVAEFLSCKAHQHKHKLKLYKFVMSDCAARYGHHSVFYFYMYIL